MDALKVICEQKVINKDFKVYGTIDNPLFLAKDVAEWIDYAWKDSKQDHRDVSKMLQSIDEDEKLRGTLFLSGQNREAWFLTENGLYEILMLSRKPIAKQFKKEVKKVLHSLRLNGGYIANQENQTPEELIASALVVAQKIIAEKNNRILEQQKKLIEQKPQVDTYMKLCDRSKTLNFRDMAAKVGMKQKEFMSILNSKYIYKNSIGEYRAYAPYQHLFELKTFFKKENETGEQLVLSMEGITYFMELEQHE